MSTVAAHKKPVAAKQKPATAQKKPPTDQQKLSVKRNKCRGKFKRKQLEPALKEIENEVDPVKKIAKIHKLYTLIDINKNNSQLWGPTMSSAKLAFPKLLKQLQGLRRSTEKFLSSRCDKAHALDIISNTKLDSDESKLEKISAVKSVAESLEEREISVLDNIDPLSDQSTMLKLDIIGNVLQNRTTKTASDPTTTASNSPEAGERNEQHSLTCTSTLTLSPKSNLNSLSGILDIIKPPLKRKHDDPDLVGHNSSNKRPKTSTSSHRVDFALECEPNERKKDEKPYWNNGTIKKNMDKSVSSEMFLEVQGELKQTSMQVGSLQEKVQELEDQLKFRNKVSDPTTKELQGVHEELITHYQRIKKKNARLQSKLERDNFFSDGLHQAMRKENLRLYRKEFYLNLTEQPGYFPDPDLQLLRAQNTWLDNEIQQRRKLAIIVRRQEKAIAEQH